MSEHCIFCRISSGKEVASFVYDDSEFMVIMDAYPLSEGHILIIPRQHNVRLIEYDKALQTRLFALGEKAIHALNANGFGLRGCNILLNDGKAANQTVPHLHLHVIPRTRNDFWKILPKLFFHITGFFGLKPNRVKLDSLAKSISAAFNP
jgi:histidine triad (HIT) family protein